MKNIMKKLSLVLLIAALLFVLAGCQGKQETLDNSTPRGAVELFVYCLAEEPDINTAYAVCEMWHDMSDSQVKSRFNVYSMYFYVLQNISIGRAQISGDTAKVEVTAKDEGKPITFRFDLRKRGDNWTITYIESSHLSNLRF